MYALRNIFELFFLKFLHRYGFSYEEYHTRKIANFVAGGAVLMSYDVVRDVIPHFFLGVSKPPMKLEDAYMGFLVMNAGISPTYSHLFQHSGNGECKFNDEAISLHFWRRSTTNEVECMKRNFVELLRRNATNEFTRLHYLLPLLWRF